MSKAPINDMVSCLETTQFFSDLASKLARFGFYNENSTIYNKAQAKKFRQRS
jgi:virulence-associated protein VapD